ncbi:hypothetical protein [Polaromonas sp. SM01]|uniref:hypothetical protein n=1 Tax=Polaromonas sp. SM01 TaxID=3085630 RepID=UPI00298146EB|nr:hypothetical protein [Polaromonas sp. SM01]MDW5443187.1 hypothetical protein [Polaromonas sp. SM01]
MKKDIGYVVELEITRPACANAGVVEDQGTAVGGGNQLHFVVPFDERGTTFKLVGGRALP